jgi:hypothetical protein
MAARHARPGAVDPSVLDALEAFVQTAARNGIVVCFNFFAFTPPLFGGTHPYLDPRALDGQTAFITAVVARFRGNGWVHWDLINEPSYRPPDQLWTHRPLGDRHEKAAWADWLKARYPGDSAEIIRARWQDPSTAGLDVLERKTSRGRWCATGRSRGRRSISDASRTTSWLVGPRRFETPSGRLKTRRRLGPS